MHRYMQNSPIPLNIHRVVVNEIIKFNGEKHDRITYNYFANVGVLPEQGEKKITKKLCFMFTTTKVAIFFHVSNFKLCFRWLALKFMQSELWKERKENRWLKSHEMHQITSKTYKKKANTIIMVSDFSTKK